MIYLSGFRECPYQSLIFLHSDWVSGDNAILYPWLSSFGIFTDSETQKEVYVDRLSISEAYGVEDGVAVVSSKADILLHQYANITKSIDVAVVLGEMSEVEYAGVGANNVIRERKTDHLCIEFMPVTEFNFLGTVFRLNEYDMTNSARYISSYNMYHFLLHISKVLGISVFDYRYIHFIGRKVKSTCTIELKQTPEAKRFYTKMQFLSAGPAMKSVVGGNPF